MIYTNSVDKNRVATYVRWSTEEQAEGTTLEVQLEACGLFIRSQGWIFRDDFLFIDDGYSGGSMDRPGLTALRKAVSDGQVSCVVVYKLDRLSRSVLDTVNLVLQEWEGVCSVRSTREPVDTTNPAGSILFYMLASFAEWERSTIKERTMSGKIKRAQQGKCPGFVCPYGYEKGPSTGLWVVNDSEAVLVRRIFREYVGGRGIHLIAAGLNRDGIHPRRATHWRGETIIKMLTNPVYTGVLRYGLSTVTTKAQRKQLGKFRIFLDEPRYANVEGAVPVIIPKEEFDRAQRVRASRGQTTGCRARSAGFLLTGLTRCRCGATIRGENRGKEKRYYRCSGGVVSNPNQCDCGMMAAELLEGAVFQKVREALAPSNRDLLLCSWQQQNAGKVEALGKEIEQMKRALERVEKGCAKLSADYKSGDLPAKLYALHSEENDREGEKLQEAMRGLEVELQCQQSSQGDLGDLGQVLEQLDAWSGLEPAEQKQILRYIVAQCVVYRPPMGRQGKGERGLYEANPHLVEVELVLRQAGA
jgi:site-specific DNA recombinase